MMKLCVYVNEQASARARDICQPPPNYTYTSENDHDDERLCGDAHAAAAAAILARDHLSVFFPCFVTFCIHSFTS